MGPFAVALLASAVLGWFAIGDILAKVGRPAVPLDDVFIHFQYARRLAGGEAFRYTGDAVSTGMTSLVWPALLAPFWMLGARGLSLVWVAWAFGTIAHAGVAVETARLAQRLTDRTGALLAGAACLVFGPFVWFAWSGMETMALTWILVAGARRAAELLEPAPAREPATPPIDPRRQELVLAALGFFAPLVRPEGALVSVLAAVAIALRARPLVPRATAVRAVTTPSPPPPRGPRRLLAAVPVLGALALPIVLLALTGHATGAPARVKWLVHNPYHDAGRLFRQVGEHAWLLFFDVLDGGEWTWIFVPKGLVLVIAFGALSLVLALRRAPWTAAITFVLFVSVVLTCSYQTFLWNRVRYAWPFVPAGFVMCACFFHELGVVLARARPALRAIAPALGAAAVARLGALLPLAVADLSQSARAVDQQQVALGEWAAAELPASALVGVNDTGAIAYFGDRRTFDIVGLTTDSEGPAWLAGAGSRFERYERLPRAELPTHFLVYPEWFGCDVLLGEELARRTVLDHAILGGDTMVAYAADHRLLGSGAEPAVLLAGERIVDEVDVADLESEAAHAFELAGAWDAENVVVVRDVAAGPEMVDGARVARARDTFHIGAPSTRALDGAREGEGSVATDARDGAVRLVMRLGADEPMKVRVLVDGAEAGSLTLPESPWIEADIALPIAPGERARVDVIALDARGVPVRERSRGGPRFCSLHYWLVVRAPRAAAP